MYAHLLLEDTDADDPRRANMLKIVKEAARCRATVKSAVDQGSTFTVLLPKKQTRAELD